ncbi:tetratricopeptide repeat protein [Saccharothrix luteola]|uniref:tetratricopeptide repeat protein n=1 Tax=Saccharothrix luteola TaxID=2893018 RepID=UPI001E3EDAF8|nr:tetratricopeptide repeat protein [Saccharothrix luteola]MCC8242793.1 tetratricopeptide repeat protein [Saccharothrix luteola]
MLPIRSGTRSNRPIRVSAEQSAAALGRRRAVSHLAQVLRTFHYQRGDFSGDLTAWQAALTAAADLPDPLSTVRAHRGVGFACAGLGRHEEALGHLHRALALAEDGNDLTQQALTHHEPATSRESGGDNRQAPAHARRALDLYRALGLPGREAVALNSVGWYAAGVGEYDTARDHCEAALILHRRHHDRDGTSARRSERELTPFALGRAQVGSPASHRCWAGSICAHTCCDTPTSPPWRTTARSCRPAQRPGRTRR